MSVAPRAFIAVVVVCGMTVLTYTVMHGSSQNPLKFFCYLVIALAASRLKVNLPSITGTMSVNFLFLLAGRAGTEPAGDHGARLRGGSGAVFRPDRPMPVQIAFNVCSTALAIAATFFAYRFSLLHRRSTILRPCSFWQLAFTS